jgi:hypothetical protein
MIKRSVSTAVGRFGKVYVVENVGKMQMRQIVGDSANLVDWLLVAEARRHTTSFAPGRALIGLVFGRSRTCISVCRAAPR